MERKGPGTCGGELRLWQQSRQPGSAAPCTGSEHSSSSTEGGGCPAETWPGSAPRGLGRSPGPRTSHVCAGAAGAWCTARRQQPGGSGRAALCRAGIASGRPGGLPGQPPATCACLHAAVSSFLVQTVSEQTKPINTELLALPVCFNQEPKPHCPSLRFSSPRPLTAPRAWWHLNHFHLASTTGPPWPQQQGTWAQHGHNMGTTTTATTDRPDTAATADHLDVMPMATGSPCTPGCCGAVVSTHHHAPYHYHHSHHSGPGHVPAILGTLQQGPSAKVQTSHAPNPS